MHRTYDQSIQLLKPDVKIKLHMRVNVQKENSTMANLTINSVTVPTNIKQGTALTIAVSVTAAQEDFDEGAAYNLLVFVNGLSAGLLGGAPLVKKGTLQDATFNATSVIVNFTVNAGSSPDVYT